MARKRACATRSQRQQVPWAMYITPQERYYPPIPPMMVQHVEQSRNANPEPPFSQTSFSNLQPFRGIVNGTSQNMQPSQRRRISRMPKSTFRNSTSQFSGGYVTWDDKSLSPIKLINTIQQHHFHHLLPSKLPGQLRTTGINGVPLYCFTSTSCLPTTVPGSSCWPASHDQHGIP